MSNQITKEFLKQVLGKSISSFSLSSGSKPGDNYLSIIYSIQLEYESDPIRKHFIIKIFPEDEEKRKYIANTHIFKKEIQVYKLWFSELETLLQNTSIQLPFPLFVSGKYVDYEKENKSEIGDLDNYLMMVDIVKTGGFRMSAQNLIDGNHCSLVVSELVKMHALSWVYIQKNGLSDLKSKFPFFGEISNATNGKELFQGILAKNQSVFLRTLEDRFGSGSPIYKRFHQWSKRDLMEDLYSFWWRGSVNLELLESFLRVRSFTQEEIRDSEPWIASCHSDCWTNNLMFHYDEKTEKPDKVILLDFQFASEQCPTLDLAFFFYMCTDLETRKGLPKFLRLYHEGYMKILGSFGVDPPKNFEDFDIFCRRFRTSKYFGLIFALLWFPLVLEPPNKAIETATEIFNPEEGSQVKEVKPAGGRVAEWLMNLAQEMHDEGIV